MCKTTHVNKLSVQDRLNFVSNVLHFFPVWDKCLFLLYRHLTCINFCRRYAMLKLTKYASASVYLFMNLWWRGGGSWWREREIWVQLNLINSEMEIISAWSTGETRDGTRESNREGKSERTNSRESGGTFGESRYFSLFLLSRVSTLTVCQKRLILELIFVCCLFSPINISSGWYDQNLLSWCEASYLKVNIRI